MGSADKVNSVLSAVPPFEGRQEIVRKYDHTANQIVQEVLDAHTAFAGDYDMLVSRVKFSKSNLEKQLFDFCKNNLHYVVEEGIYQSTRSPAGILQLGSLEDVGVDCKHYAGYIAGVLDATNRANGNDDIDWYYRFASYDSNREPGHVFVVVKYADDDEVWIDPVLGRLDQRFPRPRFYQDKKPKSMPLVRLSGIVKPMASNKMGCACEGCKNAVGATPIAASAAQHTTTGATKIETVGTALETVGVAAEAIPGVGTVAGAVIIAVGALTTLAGKLFGSNWHSNNEVRWLIAYYQYWVLGQQNVTSDNHVNEAYLQDAYNWFFAVLGVPVYDRNTVAILGGFASANGRRAGRNYSYAERAAQYLSYPEIQSLAHDVTIEQAETAARLADQLQFFSDPGETKLLPAGSWAKIPVAAFWIDKAVAENENVSVVMTQTNNQLACGTGFPAVICWAKNNPIAAAVIGVAALGFVYSIFTPSKNSGNV